MKFRITLQKTAEKIKFLEEKLEEPKIVYVKYFENHSFKKGVMQAIKFAKLNPKTIDFDRHVPEFFTKRCETELGLPPNQIELDMWKHDRFPLYSARYSIKVQELVEMSEYEFDHLFREFEVL